MLWRVETTTNNSNMEITLPQIIINAPSLKVSGTRETHTSLSATSMFMFWLFGSVLRYGIKHCRCMKWFGFFGGTKSWSAFLCSYRVHSADHYLQEAKKLKHNADALVRISLFHLRWWITKTSHWPVKVAIAEITIGVTCCAKTKSHFTSNIFFLLVCSCSWTVLKRLSSTWMLWCLSLNVGMPWRRAPKRPSLHFQCMLKQWSSSSKDICVFLLFRVQILQCIGRATVNSCLSSRLKCFLCVHVDTQWS